MNSPLENRKVRLRGLGGPAVCGVRDTCASATGDYRIRFATGIIRCFAATTTRNLLSQIGRLSGEVSACHVAGCLPPRINLPQSFLGEVGE
jgi:hypothetical protein